MDEALEKQLTALIKDLLSRPHVDRLIALNFLTQGLLRGSEQFSERTFTPLKTEPQIPAPEEGTRKREDNLA